MEGSQVLHITKPQVVEFFLLKTKDAIHLRAKEESGETWYIATITKGEPIQLHGGLPSTLGFKVREDKYPEIRDEI